MKRREVIVTRYPISVNCILLLRRGSLFREICGEARWVQAMRRQQRALRGFAFSRFILADRAGIVARPGGN